MTPLRIAAALLGLGCAGLAAPALADDGPAPRPVPLSNRWQEDWSPLADPALRDEAFDALKYVALPGGDARRFVSFGANLRERYEASDAPRLGSGERDADRYLLQRAQLHADLRVERWRAFAQLEDVRAYGKDEVGPADANRLDLRLAFLAYRQPLAGGVLNARVGRQDFAFDLQRFVSLRNGPNVRQSFDAAWLNFERGRWRLIGFVSRPVQYRDGRDFDDRSNGHLVFHTLRAERQVLGDNELSAYYSRYGQDDARYGDAAGDEHRDIVDLRFAGTLPQASDRLDWDLEAMGQRGRVGAADVRAWALGARGGWRFGALPWTPRLGLQGEAASGDRRAGDGRLETFNPLFPNGSYFTLAGYTGYVNLLHLRPSLSLSPAAGLTLAAAWGLQWRQTRADAVYLQPDLPVAGTAGRGHRWTGSYSQLRADWRVNAHASLALEYVHYAAGASLRAAGAHDSDYLGLELGLAW
ncbi:alginate export family protein [Solimonas flava]|uniref:alginate export family protein n=1 Tax=Solimonas flava TaxID=415849 RepID=UPI00040833F2|nr:alginate export family protein [Solimonas flava]